MRIYNTIILFESTLLYAGGTIRQYKEKNDWIDALLSKRAMQRNLAISIVFVIAITFSQMGLGFAAVAMMTLIMISYLISFANVLGAVSKELESKYLGA